MDQVKEIGQKESKKIKNLQTYELTKLNPNVKWRLSSEEFFASICIINYILSLRAEYQSICKEKNELNRILKQNHFLEKNYLAAEKIQKILRKIDIKWHITKVRRFLREKMNYYCPGFWRMMNEEDIENSYHSIRLKASIKSHNIFDNIPNSLDEWNMMVLKKTAEDSGIALSELALVYKKRFLSKKKGIVKYSEQEKKDFKKFNQKYRRFHDGESCSISIWSKMKRRIKKQNKSSQRRKINEIIQKLIGKMSRFKIERFALLLYLALIDRRNKDWIDNLLDNIIEGIEFNYRSVESFILNSYYNRKLV